MKSQVLILLTLTNSYNICLSQKYSFISLETISEKDIPQAQPGQDEPETSLLSEEEKKTLIKSLFQKQLYAMYQDKILTQNFALCIRNNNLEKEDYSMCFDPARIATRASLISALKQKPKSI
jgi:hypothetical protein